VFVKTTRTSRPAPALVFPPAPRRHERLIGTVFAAASFALLVPTAAQAWTKTYVMEWMEPAFHYGGSGDGNPDAPGSDCPTGSNEFDLFTGLVTPYRTKEEVNWLLSPEAKLDAEKFRALRTAFAFRGPRKENVYTNPTSVPDPGLKQVEGKISEGLDLDDNPHTGFVGVDGTLGVDNQFYRTAGCVRRYRGPFRKSGTANTHMEGMRNGMYSVLIVLTGKGADPMNDEDVSVGLYSSKQAVVKDAAGDVAHDYSFVVEPDPRFQTVFSARTRNGVLEERGRIPVLRTHDSMQVPRDVPTLELLKARVKLTMNPDGSLDGLIAGYRNWYEFYHKPVGSSGNGFQNGRGPTQGAVSEIYGHYNLVGMYYALRRNADGIPNKDGQNTAISVAYRYSFKPAFAVTPTADKPVEVAQIFEEK